MIKTHWYLLTSEGRMGQGHNEWFRKRDLVGIEGIAAATIGDAMLSCINKDGLTIVKGQKTTKKGGKRDFSEVLSKNYEDCLWLLTEAEEFFMIIMKEEYDYGFRKIVQDKLRETHGYKALRRKIEEDTEEAKEMRELLAKYQVTL